MLHYQREHYAFFRAYWHGNLELPKLPSEAKMVLPRATLDYLSVVGLPRNHDDIYHNATFSPFPQQFRIIEHMGKRYIPFGIIPTYSGGAIFPICLHVPTGKVFVVYQDIQKFGYNQEISPTFANSSLQQYFAIVIVYSRLFPLIDQIANTYRNKWSIVFTDPDEHAAISDAVEYEIGVLHDHFRNQIKAIDASALVQEESYWSQALLFVL